MSGLVRVGTSLDHDAALAVWQSAQAGLGRRNGGTRAQRVRAELRAGDALLLVAEHDASVAGVLVARLARDDDGAVLLQVSIVAVVPALQRSGVGRSLLEALRARYPRFAAVVPQDDAASLALFIDAGLRPTGGSNTDDTVRLETPP